jgi:exo-beta-N-acetylmuramidase NamZ-like protein
LTGHAHAARAGANDANVATTSSTSAVPKNITNCMAAKESAARKSIPSVVLDRPNPLGGEIVEGALLDPAFKSFVGMYPIPARHGMTVGELATFFNKEFSIGVELIIARTANWRNKDCRRRGRRPQTGGQQRDAYSRVGSSPPCRPGVPAALHAALELRLVV